ncbi:uncharacterized protein LOC100905362 [Galendromus occidentalis]|uniref:Uncharacterized protein LOC100905362 n=1 Tax=Galendromus occidentalis TaxID=34638 RepID=A0AAJ6QMH5_9ACAR|nr:uncharacterized protein LOC100905362 [Galendromus occidentalis]
MPQFQGTIRVVFMEFHPYVMRYTGANGETRLHGLMAGLFTNITASLNLSYIASTGEDGECGMPLPNETFNGGFLMLQQNKSDLGLGPFVSEEQPFRHFAVMPALHFTRVAVLSGMETAFVTEVANFMMTIDLYVWALLLVCPLILSSLMSFRDSFRARIDHRKETVFSSYLLKLVECLLQESCSLPHRDFFHRLLFAPWILGAFIVMQTFAGLLKANTAVKSPTSRIDSLEDLIADERVSIYYPRNMIIDTILHSIPGERGRKFNEVLNKRGRGVTAAELYAESVRLETVHRKAVIVSDQASLTGCVGHWCTTTPEFYYFAGEFISFLHGTWYTRKDMNSTWREAIKMK